MGEPMSYSASRVLPHSGLLWTQGYSCGESDACNWEGLLWDAEARATGVRGKGKQGRENRGNAGVCVHVFE